MNHPAALGRIVCVTALLLGAGRLRAEGELSVLVNLTGRVDFAGKAASGRTPYRGGGVYRVRGVGVTIPPYYTLHLTLTHTK